MQLSKAGEEVLMKQPMFIVAEAGFDSDDEPYMNLIKCSSMSEAEEVFIERLKSFVGYEEEDDDDDEDTEEHQTFEDEYDEFIYNRKYTDYMRYILQIKMI